MAAGGDAMPDTSAIPASQPDPSPGLLAAFTSLPCVSETLHAITTFDIGPVTRLLEQAAFLPLLLTAESRRVGDAFEVAAEPRRFEIAARSVPAGPGGTRLAGYGRADGRAASLRCRWRVVPEDYVGHAREVTPLPALPLLPGTSQRLEVFDWDLAFHGGSAGYRAYGTGRTLPGVGGPAAGAGARGGAADGLAARGTGVAFVLDVLEARGELAGLPGTVVAAGWLGAGGELDVCVVTRIMVPAGGTLVEPPTRTSPRVPAAAGGVGGSGAGATYMSFAGQVDPSHPVTLRLSLTEGILGSNVFELLRASELDFDVAGAGGPLRGGAVAGELVGSVGARLSFDPLSLCALSPVQTRAGVFEFHDAAGRSLGSVAADMTEGRSFRTRVPGQLLPVFRFGGFGPIQSGTGEFAGARGIMSMNSVISVQPRTLANSYILRFDDPDGRYRAAAAAAAAIGGPRPAP